MVNALTPLGLVINTLTEIVANLNTGMQTIYGSDINVDSNSPDGQLINIYAQVAEDILELIQDVYNSFTVDSAYGTVLDQRVAINGITRRQGTFTTTPVSITVNQALTLTGLDALVADPTAVPFTVQDNANNKFQLVTTHVFGSAGSASLTFQAVDIGQVEVLSNTITSQVTTVLGVTVVNNPSTSGTVLGVNEETDAQLKVRHAQSFALASTGPADAISAALLAIPDITDAYVVENVQDTIQNTVPAHGIWVIVAGGTDAEIGQAIYAKKGLGCDMKGSNSYVVSRPNGTDFTALWDTAESENLYIAFTINGINPATSFDTTLIATQLAAALIYRLGQGPNIGDVVSAMLTIAPNAYLTSIGVGINGTDYFDVIQPSDAQHYFLVLAANITIST